MAQNLKHNRSDNRGGSREGSGRKKLGNVTYKREVSPYMVTKLDEFLKKIKSDEIHRRTKTTP